MSLSLGISEEIVDRRVLFFPSAIPVYYGYADNEPRQMAKFQ